MLVAGRLSAGHIEDMKKGRRYRVRFLKPMHEDKTLWAKGFFKGTYKGFALSTGNQLFANFKDADSIDIQYIIWPVYPA